MNDETPFGDLTPEQIGQYIAQAEKALAMFQALAILTPTSIDDTVLVALRKFVDAIKPFAGEPWFVGLLQLVLDYFWKQPASRPLLEKLLK